MPVGYGAVKLPRLIGIDVSSSASGSSTYSSTPRTVTPGSTLDKVNVIAYDHEVMLWRTAEPPVLHPLEPANRAEALTYVDGFKPRGATNTVGALERAFQVENVRCIYLLSDGAPYMDGKNVPADDVLAVVQRNADKGVVIHTLAFPGVPKDMMKAIAEKTGGTYRDIQ